MNAPSQLPVLRLEGDLLFNQQIGNRTSDPGDTWVLGRSFWLGRLRTRGQQSVVSQARKNRFDRNPEGNDGYKFAG